MVALQNSSSRFNPWQFALWLGLATIIMMFGALSSAYIVRQGAGNWLEFRLPQWFFISTVVILVSSGLLLWANRALNKSNFSTFRILTLIAFILGIVFLVCQYFGWIEMFNSGIDLKGNPSGSFVYVMSGLHAAHVLVGVVILGFATLKSWSVNSQNVANRKLKFQLSSTYWHFVDILWIYLILFFIFQR